MDLELCRLSVGGGYISRVAAFLCSFRPGLQMVGVDQEVTGFCVAIAVADLTGVGGIGLNGRSAEGGTVGARDLFIIVVQPPIGQRACLLRGHLCRKGQGLTGFHIIFDGPVSGLSAFRPDLEILESDIEIAEARIPIGIRDNTDDPFCFRDLRNGPGAFVCSLDQGLIRRVLAVPAVDQAFLAVRVDGDCQTGRIIFFYDECPGGL